MDHASASAARTGIHQAQYYYDPYYAPYYYPYPRYYRYFRDCEEDLGYGRTSSFGCGG